MYRQLLLVLNIKLNEAALVRKLFTIQFFLGIATAFYFTSTLTMFISTYKLNMLPVVYIISALLLFGFNKIYAHYDEKLNSPLLLEMVIIFSAVSILVFWVLLNFFDFQGLKLIISAWYMIIYMLISYGFWGMASIMFNVRESKRLFSIVGAGDIPAKMLGYFSVTALVKYVSISNLLWVSVVSLTIAYFLMKRYQNQGFIVGTDPNEPHEHSDHNKVSTTRGLLKRIFHNRLIMHIAILSILSYVVFAFIDFTFLADIKLKFRKTEQIAVFIGIFFAVGRLLAITIKLVLSSRLIARMGLSNSLLLTPLLLLIINVIIVISGSSIESHLYVFGVMVLLTEVLRSTLQDPVFFILFQPLKPHDRLRGHLVAKGYTMPFALVGVGLFLYFYMQQHAEVSIDLVSKILVIFILCWIGSIYLIKKEYLSTLVKSLQKGYFTGAELFLNNKEVISSLISKTKSQSPIEVIHALNLLERSGYSEVYKLLLENLNNPAIEIKEYVLGRVIQNNMTGALPLIKKQIELTALHDTNPALIKAFYFLEKDSDLENLVNIHGLPQKEKKPAIIGLLHRHDEDIKGKIMDELGEMAAGSKADKLLVLDIIMDSVNMNFSEVLKILLLDKEVEVYKKAIETTGKVKDYNLFNEIIEVAAKHKAYPALQKSLLFYGDAIFSVDYLTAGDVPATLLPYLIRSAGKTKGDNSTLFLLKSLEKQNMHGELIIEALWLKKCLIAGDEARHIDGWVQHKIEQSRQKIVFFNDLVDIQMLQLLQEAIGAELVYDLQVLLKAFALLYERQKVDRVLELILLDNKERIYNAIEVLELLLPNKYFTQLNILVELINDIRQKQVLLPKSHEQSGAHIIEEILKDNKANFNEWTRSVACYMLPKYKRSEISLNMLHAMPVKEEALFNETRTYVLSMLK